MSAAREPLVRGEGLTRAFRRRAGLFGRGVPVMALRGVDVAVHRGEALGVVGESGCGKSTLGRVLLRLMPPTDGRVLFEGEDLAQQTASRLRVLRRRMQMVFQDPYGSLDPRRTVGAQIADGMVIHGLARGGEAREKVAALLRQVGLDPDHARRLPHEFSGGQRQRIAVARALATQPDFIVADEPVSALDVSIQAQVVNLLADLRAELGLALLFISHDLHVVRHLCDRVVVMYLGHVMEQGPAAELFRAPAHPYTRALLAATPSLRHRGGAANPLVGEVPSIAAPPSGCVFRTRCAMAQPRCAEGTPPLAPMPGAPARQLACHRAAELAP
ncbi:ATP-binding cassette domain-containing protein [Roseomonas eburnea]|uniref:ATP-binding cassette domain-containing protein n=1 Tax=Neoroseomonas eburnea TaxID=1346889 RepID=A0A9X9X9M1_9PROT|nr:oligopeptide/dipeptide ABC transporter ATP-binding protein [Neoroseomonas eburnea]MBR0680407.1 ATP-binding cassette domain-containing protein [Neoroseomonas eburnea]